MDALVQTGQTRSQGDTVLVSKTLTSEGGEQVFVLLQIDADASASKGFQKECIDTIQQAFVEADGDTAQRLDSTLKELNGLIKGLILSKAIKDFHAIIAIATGDGALHVSHAGRAEAYVIRSGVATQITEYSKGKPSPAFVHIASGQLEDRDIAILSTQRLLRTVTPAQLANLAGKHHALISELKGALEAEKEQAAFATLKIDEGGESAAPTRSRSKSKRPTRSSGGKGLAQATSIAQSVLQKGAGAVQSAVKGERGKKATKKAQSFFQGFLADLKDPTRKRKAHLLLLAAVVALFLVIWAVANLTSFSQRSQSKSELKELVEEINSDIRTAENRRLTGNVEDANALLQRAEERAKQVIANESGYFRDEAMEIFARIQSKKEEINNIVRLSPRTVINLAADSPNIKALGLIGLEDEEFLIYDKRDLFRAIHNNIDEPKRIGDEELLLHGVHFDRYQTDVFQTTGNGMVEMISGVPSSMKTDDPAGWVKGEDIETYLRYLYILSPENNQIYKYERLSDRYSAPDEYNINADLVGALDMTIDSSIYIIKEGGELVKLLRGEVQPFTIRHGEEDLLKNATKIFKVTDGNIYLLDPVRSRVVIVTPGGPSGESSYVKQYVLAGDERGDLQDLFGDADELRLYVMDEKRVYKIDL